MCPKGDKSFGGWTTLLGQGSGIFPVLKISLKAKSQPVYFYCMLDTGGQQPFFLQEVLNQLGSCKEINPKKVKLPVNTLIGVVP